MTLHAVYKCRLCGKKYLAGKTGPENAERCMVMLNVGLLNPDATAPTMTATHYCGADYDASGGLGLADFLGWQKENLIEDEEE